MYLVNYIHLENVKYLQKRLNAGSDEENSSKARYKPVLLGRKRTKSARNKQSPLLQH